MRCHAEKDKEATTPPFGQPLSGQARLAAARELPADKSNQLEQLTVTQRP